MDGFRERLGGRYERAERQSSRADRYDRSSEDRYERSSRRPEGVNIEAISDAVLKCNREQLDVIADMFDDARADRLESEKAIIDAVSHMIPSKVEEKEEAVKEPNSTPIDTILDNEVLLRIERMTGQNAESLGENNEMLERSVNSLRSNVELLNDIKNSINEVISSQNDLKSSSQTILQNVYDASMQQQQPVGYAQGFENEKEEILGAVGDNRAILNMIRQDIITGFAKDNYEEPQEDNKPQALSQEAADKYYKDLEEHVHKECVKCYRNVQSALTEQNAETEKKLTKTVGGVHTIAVVSLALNFVTIVLIVCRILGIL